MTEPLPDLRDPSLPEAAVRAALNLLPHPEGGHYRELWRDRPEAGGRGAASTILFLLSGRRALPLASRRRVGNLDLAGGCAAHARALPGGRSPADDQAWP